MKKEKLTPIHPGKCNLNLVRRHWTNEGFLGALSVLPYPLPEHERASRYPIASAALDALICRSSSQLTFA